MIPREVVPVSKEKTGPRKARRRGLTVLGISALSGLLVLFANGCDHLHDDRSAAQGTHLTGRTEWSVSSIGFQPFRLTATDELRLQNAFDAGLSAYQAAENQRTLNPSVSEVLASSHPSTEAASQRNWERAIAVFKQSIYELRKSKPESVSAAARKLERTFRGHEREVNVLVLNTVTFYDSRQRNEFFFNTEDLKRDISSLHTQISPSQDPAIIRSDRMFE
jgi:hypothetical protein